MAVLDFPPILAQSAVWGPLSNTNTHRSPLTQGAQTQELPGALWSASLSFNTLNQTKRRALQVFLLRLRGEAGRFYLGDPLGKEPIGPAGGAPAVDGGAQDGTSLVIKNAAPSVTGWMIAGDYFAFDTGVGREMKQLVEDADTDGTGATTLVFEPPIRNAPADSTLLMVRNATCVMKLADDKQALMRYRRGPFGSVTLNIEEAYF